MKLTTKFIFQILKENPTSTLPATKKTEIISILKRRNTSTENLAILNSGDGSKLTSTTSMGGSSSVNSQTLSEDSNHDESDSDWDGFPVIADTHHSEYIFLIVFLIFRIANAVAVVLILRI